MFTLEVEFNTEQLVEQLHETFGVGGVAQYTWSRIVFDGSEPYMPMVTATFRNLSKSHSESLMAEGELVYPGPFAHYLWIGILYVDPETGSAWARKGVTKVPTGQMLTYNQEANPNAGARWVERAMTDNYAQWVEEMQNHADAGFPMGK